MYSTFLAQWPFLCPTFISIFACLSFISQNFCFILCAITIKIISANDEPLNTTTNGLIDELTQGVFLTGEDPDSIKGIKRTASYRGQHKFNSPIVVHENLFVPAVDTPRKQINVQIIEPESHNNGQFLKETTYVKEENSTIVSSTSTTTTTSTTEVAAGQTASILTTTTQRPYTASLTQKSLSSKFLAPIQAGLRLSNEQKQNFDEDCDDESSTAKAATTTTIGPTRKEEQRTVVNVHKNVRVNKVFVQPGPYGARKLVGIPIKKPCAQPNKCGEENGYLPPLSPTPIPLAPTVKIVERLVKVPPVIIHTQTEVPVEVEKLIVQEVQVPVTVEKVVEKIVDRPVEVERIVEKHIPIDRIIEKFVDRPVEVERIVEKEVPVHIPVDRIVDRIIDRPVEVEKIVEKETIVEKPYPVEKVVEKFIDRPVPVEVGVPVHVLVPYHVEIPIHTPYLLEKNIPYPVHVHIPYLLKPPPKQHYFIKTNKAKEHGLFDFKHHHHHHQKTIKHIFLKQPNIIGETIDSHHSPHPYPFDAFGLLPPPVQFQTIDAIPSPLSQLSQLSQLSPLSHNLHIEREPRFQSIDSYGPQAAASVNVINTALPPASLNSFHTHHFHSHKNNHVAHQLQRPNFSGGLNLKELRWEYGFKPPLIPSTEIDDFGNPIKKHLT